MAAGQATDRGQATATSPKPEPWALSPRREDAAAPWLEV
jgi:hypothetical protein